VPPGAQDLDDRPFQGEPSMISSDDKPHRSPFPVSDSPREQ
jgi:hypothetical protein